MNLIDLNEVVVNEIATVNRQYFSTNKEGNPRLIVEFVFDNIADSSGAKFKITKFWKLDDETKYHFMFKDLSILGWNGRDIFELDPETPDHYSLVGAKAKLVTTNVDGKIYIKYINDPNYTPSRGIDVSAKSKLQAKIKSKLAAYRAQVKSTPTVAKVDDSVAEVAEEEIEF